MISQTLIILLMADAAWVAYGIYRKKNRWPWICMYWVILTIKNLVDLVTAKHAISANVCKCSAMNMTVRFLVISIKFLNCQVWDAKVPI